ncbi:MAG: hypothetical protein IT382_20235 [Deltaproteobacteria bacterium]|nr:hypothetical protein [Deltaproteobacteria bacterium]
MGFRKHRRHRGGGGGGGGGHHHHYSYGTGEANGVQPGDDVGNRRQLKPVHVPPDDIGNRRDPDESEWVPEDSVGNRIEASPTHELSGVLLGLDARRRRRPKGVSAPERVGRYLVGGVNPLIAANVPRPYPGKTLEESFGGGGPRPYDEGRPQLEEEGGGSSNGLGAEGGRRERRERRGDGAQELSERRTQRFFDFEEDDRFEYTLKTTAEQKRADAESCVRDIVSQAGRDATVLARLIEDGTRPKVLVTVEERGPSAAVPVERRAASAGEPLFVMGNGALMSLNYLVNKIVNRFPDDRIRLAILPAADERLYVDALAEHRKQKPLPGAAGPAATTTVAVTTTTTAAPAPAPMPSAPVLAAPAAAPTPMAKAAPAAEVLPVGAASTEAPPTEAAPTEAASTGAAAGDDGEAEPAEKARPARRTTRAARDEPKDEPKDAADAAPKRRAAKDDGEATPKRAAKDDGDGGPRRRLRDDGDEGVKRPVRRPIKKTPAVEVVVARAPRSKG